MPKSIRLGLVPENLLPICEILVDDHNAAFIQIGQHLQFRIDDFSGIAGVLSDTMAA